jgi:histidinol-phosphatase
MAALDVIVREAGGRFTNIEGKDGSWGASGMSTNSALHEVIVDSLN